jgi:acetyltransferase
MLNLEKTLELLKKYDIPFVPTQKIKNLDEAFLFVQKHGYPVVVKIFSEDILHRTELGGVFINLLNENDLTSAFNKLQEKFTQKDTYILIQKHIPGIYLMAGAKIDETFGPSILFGLGGIFVEILKSTSLRLAPINISEAKKMIKENNGYQILAGARNQKSINFDQLEKILVNLSKMICSEEIIKEIDINPLVANDKEVIAVDVKIIT